MTPSLLVVTCVYVVCPLMTSLRVDGVVPPKLDSFDELVNRLMDCRRVPGLVAAVVDLRRPPGVCGGGGRADPVVVERQYGWADVDARRPMMSSTRVCIASLTKAFTSALLGIMLQNITRQVPD